MAAFILRRLGQAILVMLTVGLIAFALFRYVGDPVIFMLGQDATPEDRARVTQQLGLDRPLWQQYWAWLWAFVHGDGIEMYEWTVPVTLSENEPVDLPAALSPERQAHHSQ